MKISKGSVPGRRASWPSSAWPRPRTPWSSRSRRPSSARPPQFFAPVVAPLKAGDTLTQVERVRRLDAGQDRGRAERLGPPERGGGSPLSP